MEISLFNTKHAEDEKGALYNHAVHSLDTYRCQSANHQQGAEPHVKTDQLAGCYFKLYKNTEYVENQIFRHFEHVARQPSNGGQNSLETLRYLA